jgi:hypothetical protein
MLSKKSKIEELPKSRESPFLAASAAASLSRTRTKLCGRLLVIRGGPSHRRARHAPAVLKNLVHLSEKPFSTASVKMRWVAAIPGFIAAAVVTYYFPARLAERLWTSWLLIVPIVGEEYRSPAGSW